MLIYQILREFTLLPLVTIFFLKKILDTKVIEKGILHKFNIFIILKKSDLTSKILIYNINNKSKIKSRAR